MNNNYLSRLNSNYLVYTISGIRACMACEQMPKTKITHGGRNVFAALGYADAGERQAKTRLTMELNKILKARKLRQVDAAKLLGIPQPKISALMNYRLDGFSVERLMDFLTSLDRDVEIVIRPRGASSTAGSILVIAIG